MALNLTWKNTIGHPVKSYQSAESCFRTVVITDTDAVVGSVVSAIDGSPANLGQSALGVVCTNALIGEEAVILFRGKAIVGDGALVLDGTMGLTEAIGELEKQNILTKPQQVAGDFGRS